MTQDSNSSFIVRFVAADRGVKSEARVQGRIAFPSNRGPQPKAGEFWSVTIQGENPKKTVYFLTCVAQVEQPADYVSPVTASKPDSSQSRKDHNGKGNNGKRSMFGGEPGKGRSSILNAAARMWTFGAPSATPVQGTVTHTPKLARYHDMVEQDYLFAPGADEYEQANAWLTPVAKVDMTNLKFASAQKAGAADGPARGIAAAMTMCIGRIDDHKSQAAALAVELKGMSQNTRDVATECVTAKKRFDAATAAKRQLQLDTLSFGRLKQSYKKDGKADDAQANAHLAVIKDELDTRRTAVNAEFEAAKNASSDAEMARHFAYSLDDVIRAEQVMSEIEHHQSGVALYSNELK